MTSRSQHAFSLVEILVSVGLIAVLATLVMPGLSTLRGRAGSTGCINNLRQLSSGLMLYSQENNGRLPSAWYQGQAGYMWYWSPDFTPYLGAPGLSRMKLGMCPAWDGGRKNGIPGNDIYVPRTYDSYTLCYPVPAYSAGYSVSETHSATPSLLQYTRPSQKLLLCDSKPNNPAYSAYAVLPLTRTAARFLQQNGDAVSKPTGFRHSRKMNAVFADGHLVALGPQDITDDMLNPEW